MSLPHAYWIVDVVSNIKFSLGSRPGSRSGTQEAQPCAEWVTGTGQCNRLWRAVQSCQQTWLQAAAAKKEQYAEEEEELDIYWMGVEL